MCEARKRLRTWVEGVACACAVTGRVLLDAATHLTWSVASELDDMEGIEDAGGVLKLIVDGVLAVPGRGPAPWDDPPLEWSTMPVSSRGPGGVGPGDATRLSSTPNTRTPAKRAGSSDAACRHGLIWDHTVFHVVASCRANPAMVAPSKRNCRITQRITRTPKRARGAHTEWFCSMKVTIRQVRSRHIHRRLNHRNLTGTPAQGASITSTTTRP